MSPAVVDRRMDMINAYKRIYCYSVWSVRGTGEGLRKPVGDRGGNENRNNRKVNRE